MQSVDLCLSVLSNPTRYLSRAAAHPTVYGRPLDPCQGNYRTTAHQAPVASHPLVAASGWPWFSGLSRHRRLRIFA